MQLSVIIPALNEEANILAAVQSAFALRPVDVVVADGGSTDDTIRIAESARSKIVRTAPGRGVQLNAGAAAATGELLLFLHADNRLSPAAAQQLSVACAAGAVAGAFRQSIEARGLKFRLLESGNAVRAQMFGAPYGDQAIWIKRKLFDQVGGFPPAPIMEDLLLMRRVRRLAKPVLLEGPVYVSPRRWEENGVVRQTLHNWSLVARLRLGQSPDRLANSYTPHSGGD